MQNEPGPQLAPNIPGLLLLIGAHGQGGHLEDANEEAQHEGTKDCTLPADPVHATRYGQAIEIRMSTAVCIRQGIKGIILSYVQMDLSVLTLSDRHRLPSQMTRAQKIAEGIV